MRAVSSRMTRGPGRTLLCSSLRVSRPLIGTCLYPLGAHSSGRHAMADLRAQELCNRQATSGEGKPLPCSTVFAGRGYPGAHRGSALLSGFCMKVPVCCLACPNPRAGRVGTHPCARRFDRPK
jgi:hypothetical protein